MGQSQSSHIDESQTAKSVPESVRGRKSVTTKIHKPPPHGLRSSIVSDTTRVLDDSGLFDITSVASEGELEEVVEVDSNPDADAVSVDASYFDDSSDEEDDEDDEEWNERLRILEDARKLKQLAEFFLHPEKPVEEGPGAQARCFFDRPSAPTGFSDSEADERSQILEDAKALKKQATDYMHPEKSVETTDPCSYGRNYFTRPSAPENEDEEERELVLSEARMLKKLAVDHMHPEIPVTCTDPTACGRNYFSRASASVFESEEEAKERDQALEEAKQLKQLARAYLHPEDPVVTTDPHACGRNYFSRPSATEQEDLDDALESVRVLEDAKRLKESASDYMHPERPVVTEPSAFGRNFFSRPSAPDQETFEDAEERAKILQDAAALKKTSVEYMHPELPVDTNGVCGRNYFARPSAPLQVDVEEAEEQARIFEDLRKLKKAAVDYLHPELPVVTTDATACGRNYFSRASAPPYDTEEEAEERELILEESSQLKQLAVDFKHPENEVVTDPSCFGRNYFSRPSAPEQDTEEDADERAQILEDLRKLKKAAEDYLHPERPVVTSDATACGRNYFTRPSAPVQDTKEEADERALILEDLKKLKATAVDYLHPEVPVVTSDSTACGRNYFSRPSAVNYDTDDEIEERERILEDTKQLKKLATDFMHPERPVVADPTSFGRNYFSRPSAPDQETEDDAKERAQIFADLHNLKKAAEDYLHPERPVVTSDSTACGRNYFSRPSAPVQDTVIEADERAQILEDLEKLKKSAVDYMHPELPVVTTDGAACGRNFFSRPSAAEVDDDELGDREGILEDAKMLKTLAVQYHHPEHPVATTDPSCCGRNYFSRPSAAPYESQEDAEEREQVLHDVVQSRKLAVDYMHPERSVSVDPVACGRNFFSRPSAVEQESPEEAEERARVLEETQALKKLAMDYMHPEKSVVTTDPTACGRNYFNRPSAAGHAHMIHTFPPHEDEHEHHSEHHVDHFGLDEDMDMFADMRQNLDVPSGPPDVKQAKSEEEGSNLSRSPSSVMLFTGEPIYD